MSTSAFNEIDNMLYGNICNSVEVSSIFPNCTNFAEGIGNQGLSPVIYYLLVASRIATEKYNTQMNNIGTSNYESIKVSALNSQNLYEVCIINPLYIGVILSKILDPVFTKVQGEIVKGIKDTFSSIETTRLSVLIPYLFVIFLSALVIWRPIFIHLSEKVLVFAL